MAAQEGHEYAQVDAEVVRAFHRGFPTGVTVVTAMGDGEPKGLVVNAFASLTIDPPRVLVCVATSAQSYDVLWRAAGFAVNVLAADQCEIAKTFARSGGDKFADVQWQPGRLGAPILQGSAGVVEAALERRLTVGTHTIFVGRVIGAEATDRSPLVYWGGRLWEPGNLRELA